MGYLKKFFRNVFEEGDVPATANSFTAATSRGIAVHEFSPAEVKLAVTGHGTASKEQIQGMVPRLIGGLEHDPAEDEADALAVALCCLHRQVREGWRDLASSREAR